VAAAALLLTASPVRADEYNKMTYLTFSGPVQVPGVVLQGGTYMFKLADPDNGRRVIQVWDKEGTKLYTTLLTIPDTQAEAKDDPVVLFTERPSGEPQAIKSWFYVGERTGYEFVYPKDQAMKIAQANHQSVLARNASGSAESDAASLSKSQVGRVNESGQFEEQQRAARANNEDNVARPSGQSASNDQSQASRTTPSTSSQSASAQSAQSTTPPAPVTAPDGNRTQSGVSTPSGSNDNRAQSTTAQSRGNDTNTNAQPRTNNPNNRTVGTSGQLPRTASYDSLIQLFAALSLIVAFGVHQFRKYAINDRA
jgi:hypothetical protein